jgi:DNA polymerase-3 subunit alpha
VKDTFLYVKGKVQQRYNDANQWEIKVTSIQLLAEVREKMVKTFSFKIDLKDISGDLIKKVHSLAKKNTGNAQLKVLVTDKSEKMFIELPSLKVRINPNNNFINELVELTNSDYKVN